MTTETTTWTIEDFDSIDVNGDSSKLAATSNGYAVAWLDRNGYIETVDDEGNLHAAGSLAIDPAEFDAIRSEIAEFHGIEL